MSAPAWQSPPRGETQAGRARLLQAPSVHFSPALQAPMCVCLLLEGEAPEGRMLSCSPWSILPGEHLRDARWMVAQRLSEKSLASDNTKC